jgi:hypothetical protein
MLTLGDVLAVVAIVFGTAVGLAALSLASGFAFPLASEAAARKAESRPIASFLLGLALSVPAMFVGLVLVALPSPLAKSAGVLLLAAWAVLLGFGTATVSWLVGQRVQAASPALPRHAALGVASLAVAVSMILPFVGWFLIGPVVALTGFGAWAGSRRGARLAPPLAEERPA